MVLFYILASVFLIGLGEYVVHRFSMHRQFWRFRDLYLEHAIEHHKKERNDINIDMWPFNQLLLTSPIIVGLWFYDPIASVVLVSMIIFHSVLWTVLHRSFHNLGCNWARSIPGYFFLRQNHLAHHDNTKGNYGIIFGSPFDYLFRTKV